MKSKQIIPSKIFELCRNSSFPEFAKKVTYAISTEGGSPFVVYIKYNGYIENLTNQNYRLTYFVTLKKVKNRMRVESFTKE